MGGSIADEEEKLLAEDNPDPKKGGHRTIPFILVNESFERLASIGLSPNMVFYLMYEYHLQAASATVLLSVWSALSNGLAIAGAPIADSYLGRFRAIILGSISSLSGMTLLWLTAMIGQLRPPSCEQYSKDCISSNAAQIFVLLCSLGLISVGAGFVRPCSLAYGIDQVRHNHDPRDQRAMERLIIWYNGATTVASIVALTIIVYIIDNTSWKIGFSVPALLMVLSSLAFILGSSFYVNVKPGKSLYTGFFQVAIAAFMKRNIDLPTGTELSYYQGEGSIQVIPSDNMSYLNKACIIKDPERDLNPDGSASDPWSLCTVEQVEALKTLLRVIPNWSSGIFFQLTALQSFSLLQAKSMNRRITSWFEVPAASIGVISVIFILMCTFFYEGVLVPLLTKYRGRQRGSLTPKTRMTIALVTSSLGAAWIAIIEPMRRGVAIRDGLVDDPKAVLDFSVAWMLPTFIMNGIGDFFMASGQEEFFYTQFSKRMSSIVMALYTLEMSAASLLNSLLISTVNGLTSKGGKTSWFDSNINKGHLEYYYWMLFVLSLINFAYFQFCWWIYEPARVERINEVDAEEKEAH